jgi:hypothetical protein
LVYVNTGTFTMVAGSHSINVPPVITTTGYSAGQFGSLTPTTDPIGNQIIGITWNNYTELVALSIAVASNPGIGYFDTIKVSSTGPTFSASAATYYYTGGVALWQWSSTTFGFTSGQSYAISIQY